MARVVFMVAVLVAGMVVAVAANQFQEGSQQIRNGTTMRLHTPKSTNNDRRSMKRKHEEVETHNDGLSGEVTLCWPNPLLRECKEVTLSRESFAMLRYHHPGDMVECICVLEGFDTFESSTREPLFIDGRVFDTFPLYVVSKYTGDPLPHLDLSIPYGSDDSSSESDVVGSNVVCWPNPLLGECKEAEISHDELNDLLAEGNGYHLDLESCSCASEGFKRTKKVPERDAGVQTYSPGPRVTLCFFEGRSRPDHGMWEVDSGVEIQKGHTCKQVTIGYPLYHSNPRTTQNFNDAGIYECTGGCEELGYPIFKESKQHSTLFPLMLTGNHAGKRRGLDLTPRRHRGTSPETVYAYHNSIYTASVTLCFFVDGNNNKEVVNDKKRSGGEEKWWRTEEGGITRKRELCNQFTMSRDLYISTGRAPRRKERFNEYGVHECGQRGCVELGYRERVNTDTMKQINLRPDTPEGGRSGKWTRFPILPRTDDTTISGVQVDTYRV